VKDNSCCSTSCCESPQIHSSSIYYDQGNFPWIVELLDSPVGKIRKINTNLAFQDILGGVKVRLGVRRNKYRVSPGLYGVGCPDDKSPVLVTANYKLTFDALRKELSNLNLWILVLDTKGINVWCAAGKGTFGTEELIQRINLVQLSKVVSHKTLILPQLGAPGVAAHQVTKKTGFKIVYGPVKAADIPTFLNNKLKATEDMRKVQFTLKDRLMVIPVEFNHGLKLIPILFVLLLAFNLVNPGEIRFAEAFFQSLANFIPYLVAFVLGTVGIAALLPYIPFRSFALKGLLLGVVWAAIVIKYNSTFQFPDSTLALTAHSLFIISITSFWGLNFTGSTTYTSLSGVQKETIYTIPVVITASLLGLILLIIDKIMLF
jgi:hypothetical protein